ncbi:MAG: Spy/CpxP family protein refolding chaperone [Candidatus Margulisbacteria bacterium]|jgi:Spy/CpxP family protein refolding chaperone|nr:Spy/CpxP family protein refolding chaperone [Candidatus Margulisiibacteriota bacterium]
MGKIKIGLAVMVLAALVLAAPGGKEKGERHSGEFFKELNLTDAQTKQLDDNRKAAAKAMQDNQENSRKEYGGLFDELAKDNPNAGRIAQIKLNILDLESKRLDNMIDNASGLKKVLTKEQFAKFQEKQKRPNKDEKKERKTKAENKED